MATIIQSMNDGDPVLEPMNYGITKSDLYSDKSGRSAESGDMLLYPIRTDVYSIELEFVGTAAEIKHIQSLIVGGDFLVVFLDEGDYVSRYMYASDRSLETLGVPNARKYRLSFSLIETRRAN